MPEPEADEMQVDGTSSDTKTDGQEIARLSRLQKSLILPQDAEYHKMLEDKILGLRRQITASKPLDTQIQTLTAALERKEEKLQQRLDGIAELQMEIKQIESERDTLKKDLEALKQEKLLELTNNNGVTEVPLQAQQQIAQQQAMITTMATQFAQLQSMLTTLSMSHGVAPEVRASIQSTLGIQQASSTEGDGVATAPVAATSQQLQQQQQQQTDQRVLAARAQTQEEERAVASQDTGAIAASAAGGASSSLPSSSPSATEIPVPAGDGTERAAAIAAAMEPPLLSTPTRATRAASRTPRRGDADQKEEDF